MVTEFLAKTPEQLLVPLLRKKKIIAQFSVSGSPVARGNSATGPNGLNVLEILRLKQLPDCVARHGQPSHQFFVPACGRQNGRRLSTKQHFAKNDRADCVKGVLHALDDVELGAFYINFLQIDMIEVQLLSHGIESKTRDPIAVKFPSGAQILVNCRATVRDRTRVAIKGNDTFFRPQG